MKAIYCILLSYMLLYFARSVNKKHTNFKGFLILLSIMSLVVSVAVVIME